MKKTINAFDYAGDIIKAMPKGILMTTKAEGKVNTMTIGWGTIGIQWGKPIFVGYVRESRHTRAMLDANGEFTVNVPVGTVDGKILGYCGTKSGRDTDKIADMNLTLEEPVSISVPGIKELPLTLECKVIYVQKEDLNSIPDDIISRYYPAADAPIYSGETRDYHIAYYGEIVNAYLIEE